MKFVFFSLRNFERDGGGSIRMYGILNALANKGNEVIFISNAKVKNKFHNNIKHIPVNFEVNNKSKRILQGLTSFLPPKLVLFIYRKLFKIIQQCVDEVVLNNETVCFFEYLDNTIGYLLKVKDKKYKYVNDIHGVSTIEFQYQYQKTSNLLKKTVYYFKYLSSYYLDKKVFLNAEGFFYASNSMRNYYENLYTGIKEKKHCILPYLLGDVAAKNKINNSLYKELLENYNLSKKDFVLFFVGGYKPTAGVDDLILAFSSLQKQYKNLRMILIGEGPFKNKCVKLVKENQIVDKVILINRVPYEDLATYQSIASVIVCPDKQNPYSDLIVHLKYFDSLSSGKIVINGDFKSVKELNKEEFLSLNFKPSDVKDLSKVIENTILNFDSLENKYKNTKKYTIDNLTYKSLIDKLYFFG